MLRTKTALLIGSLAFALPGGPAAAQTITWTDGTTSNPEMEIALENMRNAWIEKSIRSMARTGMSTEQIAAQFQRHGVNFGSDMVETVLLGEYGVDMELTSAMRGLLQRGDTDGLQRELMRQGYILAEDLIEQYAPDLMSYVKGGVCSPMVMDVVAGAASAVAGIFTGGRATVIAQLAQQLQLMWANKCSAETNDLLRNQRQLQEAMVRGIDKNVAARAAEVEAFARSALGAQDPGLYAPNADEIIWKDYQAGMPEGWTFQTAPLHMQIMRERTAVAAREAALTQARSQASIQSALEMSDAALDLSMGADGQTQAIQAQTQMLRSQIAVDAASQGANAAMETAELRTAEEQRAQEIMADQKLERLYGPGTVVSVRSTGRNFFQ